MSNPIPPNLPPGQVPADYAPSDSGSEDSSIAEYDENRNEPAFRNLPDMRTLNMQLLNELPPEPESPQMRDDGNFHLYVPAWTSPDADEDDEQSVRRPALMSEDGVPSTYARYVCVSLEDWGPTHPLALNILMYRGY